MALNMYNRRIVRKRSEREVASRRESMDAILWDILPSQRQARVKVQGSDIMVVVYYPENWEQTPFWLKPGNSVRIAHSQGIRGRLELVGHGRTIPSPIAGDQSPTIATPPDAIITGVRLSPIPNNRQMAVMVEVGTYRIDGNLLTLGEILMSDTSNFTMDMGGRMGQVAGIVDINAAPPAGNARVDIVVVGADGVIDYIAGTNFTTIQIIPATPAGHVRIGRVLVLSTTTEIEISNINVNFLAPQITSIEMVIADEELLWTELTTNIDVFMKDQNGNPITQSTGWPVELEIIIGNGQVSSVDSGSSTVKVLQRTFTDKASFVYTRDQASGDQSPTLIATLEINFALTFRSNIFLLDSGGDVMN